MFLLQVETKLNGTWYVDHNETETFSGNRKGARKRANELIDGNADTRVQIWNWFGEETANISQGCQCTNGQCCPTCKPENYSTVGLDVCPVCLDSSCETKSAKCGT